MRLHPTITSTSTVLTQCISSFKENTKSVPLAATLRVAPLPIGLSSDQFKLLVHTVMPSSTSRSRSLDIDIRRYRGNPRASLDSRVENVVLPPDNISVVTRSVVSLSPARDSRSRGGPSRSRSRGPSRSRSRDRSHSRSREPSSSISSRSSRSPRRNRRSRSRSSRRSYRSPASNARRNDRSRSPLRRRHRSPSSDRIRAPRQSLASDTATGLSREKVRSLRSWMLNWLSWLSTHYKIMDIARPLIQLWSSLPPNDPHLQHIESALRLWGVAFRDVTMNRRKNILRQTAPDFLNLFSDPKMFSNHEMSVCTVPYTKFGNTASVSALLTRRLTAKVSPFFSR
ncbi:hypothetical protein DAPPUDRAFT_109829 [Daphnia pulex]|uniref:Uncharacterized protein n=1 Tax=Daphnia pulex TaxID=6669 RepID=E9H4C2_DAPPU|nr:hypothetical protein DAPPUDRAFT_109829 [Daphnia pulex]|eukprot:EFX73425.1 hypothetical protein DAPPUDRAFT_109829 [Daphnia pulex]